jgi:hypothetical protein
MHSAPWYSLMTSSITCTEKSKAKQQNIHQTKLVTWWSYQCPPTAAKFRNPKRESRSGQEKKKEHTEMEGGRETGQRPGGGHPCAAPSLAVALPSPPAPPALVHEGKRDGAGSGCSFVFATCSSSPRAWRKERWSRVGLLLRLVSALSIFLADPLLLRC